MRNTTTVIIGAGQCGLAMSHELTKRSIDHIVLDSGRAGERWRTSRWDSLRLLTPNWMNALAGQSSVANDPAGFMTAKEFATSFDVYLAHQNTPLLEETKVVSLRRYADGYQIDTNRGPIACRTAVVATGACALPKIPVFAQELPSRIAQYSPTTYRRPSQLPDGNILVVGASASGLQIARELAASGRGVTLAVGNHGRLPRTYKGADILDWMHLIGAFDEPFSKVDDIERVRRTPSLPLIGSPERVNIDLNALQALGVEITGRFADIRDGRALFSGGLANMCVSADLKQNRLLDRIDVWAMDRGIDLSLYSNERPEPTRVPKDPRLSLDLTGVSAVVWATGFAADHRFVQLPVFDRKGRIMHNGGLVEPGLCVMGLPHMRTARSVHIDGAGRDAKALARQMMLHLSQPLAA